MRRDSKSQQRQSTKKATVVGAGGTEELSAPNGNSLIPFTVFYDEKCSPPSDAPSNADII